jgi:hypothetical protein
MQIQTTAKIEKCEIVKKGNTIKVSNLKLTSGQVETMADIVNDGGQVLITIEAVQQKLPGMDDGEDVDVDKGTGEISKPKKGKNKKTASEEGNE